MKKNVLYAILIIVAALPFSMALWKLLSRYSVITLIALIFIGMNLVILIITVIIENLRNRRSGSNPRR